MMPASVTVTLCLAVPVLAMLIFGLLEAARYHGLKSDAKEWGNLAAESLFAGYQPFLLKEYQMFFLDGGFGTEKLNMETAEDRVEALLYDNLEGPASGKGMFLYRLEALGADVTKVRLATDGDGKVFEMQAADVMKREIGRRAAKEILGRMTGVKGTEQEGREREAYLDDAKNALEELQKQREEAASKERASSEAEALPGGVGAPPALPENPMETVSEIRKKGILALVYPENKTISGKSIRVNDSLMKRNCQKGTYALDQKPGWYERILMQEYVKEHAGNALAPKEDGELSYGTEYVLCGKDSDEKNLEKTANKLAMLREAANFLYLQTDVGKQAQALEAAAMLAGASANPAVVAVVKQGILAAWAYAESLCDVKALLSGGRVPLIKNAENWKTSLFGLGEAIANDSGGGESEGLSYEDCLDALLYGKSVKTLAYRSMDLMEKRLQKEEKNAAYRMDHMVTGAAIQTEYAADTLFLGIFGADPIGGYYFLERAEYAYGF